jgi:hypothetical protein
LLGALPVARRRSPRDRRALRHSAAHRARCAGACIERVPP